MSKRDTIDHVAANFSRIYLGGIPSLLNDDGAFLAFICCLTATEALGGFLCPNDGNARRFKKFIKTFFPVPYPDHVDLLWKLRNATIHGFSPGPFKLTHHNSHLHWKEDNGAMILNAEDLYAALAVAFRRYLDNLIADPNLQDAFEERTKDPDTAILTVGPLNHVAVD